MRSRDVGDSGSVVGVSSACNSESLETSVSESTSTCGSIEGRSRQRECGLLDHGVGWEQQGVQEAREGGEAGGTPSVPGMIFECH